MHLQNSEIAAQLRVAAISLNICSFGARMDLVSRALVLSIIESELLYGFLWDLAQPNGAADLSGYIRSGAHCT